MSQRNATDNVCMPKPYLCLLSLGTSSNTEEGGLPNADTLRDGGGIRGLSELIILEEIMRRIKWKEKLSRTPIPADRFDLIGGTSTGGLIAILLGRLRLSVADAITIYQKLASTVFSQRKLKGQDGRYPASKLEEAIKDVVKSVLGSNRVNDRMFEGAADSERCRAFVCAVGTADVTHPAGPTLFRTYDVRRNRTYNCTIWEAARATSAAPTFFKRIRIGPPGSAIDYVDAGLGCNNPVKQVLAEAAREFGDHAHVACVLSIGTGQANAENFGTPSCCQRVVPLDLIRVLQKIATDSGSTAEEMDSRYRKSGIYHRLDVDRGLDAVYLDEWKRLGDVRARTENYLKLNQVSCHVDKIVNALSRPYNAPTQQLGSLVGRVVAATQVFCQQSPMNMLGPIGEHTHWMVTRSLNSYFTGRDDILKEIKHAILFKSQEKGMPRRYVITGIGGQGKSELCLKVVDDLRRTQRFWGIFWVDVSAKTTAESGYIDIAKRLGAHAESLEAAKQIVSNLHHDWILVLDNADDPRMDYQQFLPSGAFGTIILTSRNPGCLKYSTIGTLRLEGLHKHHARDLLLKAAMIPSEKKSQEKQHALDVALLLEYHPLALISAGAYVACGHCKLSQYRAAYESQKARVFEFSPEQHLSRYRNVFATFEASAHLLESSQTEVSEDALDLLSTMSMLDYTLLPLPLFEDAWRGARRSADPSTEQAFMVQHLSSWHVERLIPSLQARSETWDEFRIRKACNYLKSFSLVSTETDSTDTTMIRMHPLIHTWTQLRQREAATQKAWVSAGSIMALAWLRGDIWRIHKQKLKSHLFSWLDKGTKEMLRREPSLEIAQILFQCGWILYSIKDHQRLFDLIKDMFGALRIDFVHIQQKWLALFELMGTHLHSFGRTEEAVRLLERVVKVWDQSQFKNHPDHMASQHLLAVAYRMNNQPQEAIKLLEYLLRVQKTPSECSGPLPEFHPYRKGSHHELARAYQAAGDVDSAVKLLEPLVEKQKTLPENHPDRLESQHMLAVAYTAGRRPQKAVELLKHVVKMREALPKYHPYLLKSQEKLAKAYEANRQVEMARVLLEQVEKSRKESLPKPHPGGLESPQVLPRAYQIALGSQ